MVSQQLEAQGYRAGRRAAGRRHARPARLRRRRGQDRISSRDPLGAQRLGYGRYGWAIAIRSTAASWDIFYGRPYYSRCGAARLIITAGTTPIWYARLSATATAGTAMAMRGMLRATIRSTSYLDMDIVRRAGNAPLFEGHAKARSPDRRARRAGPESDRGDVHRLPGHERRDVRITVPAGARKR